jgi:hypothetical protein
MRSPSTTPSPSELSDLSTLSKKKAPQKRGATRPGGEGVRRTMFHQELPRYIYPLETQ